MVYLALIRYLINVALRKESVDRNILPAVPFRTLRVALRKESVDRNSRLPFVMFRLVRSLSARRAWIEILLCGQRRRLGASLSARRAWIEIIDDLEPSSTRKSLSARRAWIEISITMRRHKAHAVSLSARRAWIEICLSTLSAYHGWVALRKESVDRNWQRSGHL